MTMIRIENEPVAQGDLLIRKIDALPADAVKVEPDNGSYIVAHSETGHHHAVAATAYTTYYQSANDNNVAYLVVDNAPDDEEIELKHLRSFDTHESFSFGNGIHELRRQIEGGLKGFIRVAD